MNPSGELAGSPDLTAGLLNSTGPDTDGLAPAPARTPAPASVPRPAPVPRPEPVAAPAHISARLAPEGATRLVASGWLPGPLVAQVSR
ncbi:hypothetical protein PV461_38315, partial [Streptomyces scabiei]|nr:hypothetical protein [Streptomyces scabiei]